MSDTHNQGEPTMEEILASIRKIISEDGSPTAQQAESKSEPEAGTPEPEDREDEDVLDLTRMVGSDGAVVDLEADAGEETAVPEPVVEPEAETNAEAVAVAEAEAEEAPMPAPSLVAVEDEPTAEPHGPRPDPDPASLVSEGTRAAATASLANLAAFAAPRPAAGTTTLTDGKTLEDLVRDVMQPYLRSWLDENLARLVEGIVRDEIQKMVRRAEYR